MIDPSEFLIVLPARLHSTRLPEKLLRADTGKPLLQHTLEQALKAFASLGISAEQAKRQTWVVCDSPHLAAVAKQVGVGAVLTGPCDSGTERIVRALPDMPAVKLVVNLQADEPEMPIAWMTGCLESFDKWKTIDVVTLATPIEAGDHRLDDPNVVKVVLDHDGFALYFSRSTIPHLRSGGSAPSPRALQHLGLYAYSTDFLRRYESLPASPLERCEMLEQLRFLQAGARIHVVVKERPGKPITGIDTPADYEAFCLRQKS